MPITARARLLAADIGVAVTAPARLFVRVWRSSTRNEYLRLAAAQSLCVCAIAGLSAWASDDALSARAAIGVFAGSLVLGQWIVNALSQSHQDALIARIVAEGGGVPPPAQPPKIGLHWRWMRRDLWNRCVALLLLLLGQVVLSPLLLVPRYGVALNGALLTIWSLYWLAVFVTVPASFIDHAAARAEPLTIERGIDLATRRIFGLRWWLPRWSARFVLWLLKPLRPARAVLESRATTFGGLTVTRLVLGVPIVWIWARPLLISAVVLNATPPRSGQRTSIAA